jgi:hypothetical protein
MRVHTALARGPAAAPVRRAEATFGSPHGRSLRNGCSRAGPLAPGRVSSARAGPAGVRHPSTSQAEGGKLGPSDCDGYARPGPELLHSCEAIAGGQSGQFRFRAWTPDAEPDILVKSQSPMS